jgi:2-iminobutanoate/2-iminopropanoate deaminase
MSALPQRIHTDNAPAAVGPYSQAMSANGMIFVSGQLPLDPATMKFVHDTDVTLQTKQCLANMKAILESTGSSMDKVAKTTILLADIADFPKVNAAYAEVFTKTLPARATFAVKDLPLGARVEIEAVAMQ